MQFEAINLFVQRARSCLPRFELNQLNAEAVVKICDLLEGLPLPIELAASRLKLFSPELLFSKLVADTNLLKTRSRDISLRHQTIRNTVQWSYDLLNESEKEVFQKVSLFRGGFTFETLEAVCPGLDALEIVESFMDKSLIVKGEEVHLAPRFRMLKLIRDYGAEQLEKNPAGEQYWENFARYFLAFVVRGKEKFRSTDQVKWVDLFQAEYENLLATLEWLIINRTDMAAALGADLWGFHVRRGLAQGRVGNGERTFATADQ